MVAYIGGFLLVGMGLVQALGSFRRIGTSIRM